MKQRCEKHIKDFAGRHVCRHNFCNCWYRMMCLQSVTHVVLDSFLFASGKENLPLLGNYSLQKWICRGGIFIEGEKILWVSRGVNNE